MDNSDQNIEFIFGDNKNYHQIGNAYLQNEITVAKLEANQAHHILTGVDTISLLNVAFDFCFKEARLATTGGSDFEHYKYVGQILTIKRVFNE